MTTIVITLAALGWALSNDQSVFSLVIMSWSGLASAFAPLLLALCFGVKPRQSAGVLAVCSGFAVALLWRYMGWHQAIYEGLPGILTGMLILGLSLQWRVNDTAFEED